MTSKKPKTTTSTFGSPSRRSHDASPFYAGRLYQDQPHEQAVEFTETPISPELLDRIYCSSAENMAELPDKSVHLMVTSPPYNVGKEYDDDLSLQEYLAFLERVWGEVYRVLVPGGRACVNVANLGRRPYIPLHAWIIATMMRKGFFNAGRGYLEQSCQCQPFHGLG